MTIALEHPYPLLRRLWNASRSLSLVGWLLFADVAACLVLMVVDSRQITGIEAWIKPVKFGFSSAVTCLTLAWITSYLTDWPRLRRWSGRVFASSIALEIVIINIQAARGTTSHFNVSTPVDKLAFVVMGVSIATLWCAMAALTYALFRQEVKGSSWKWALRSGLLISLVGAAAGGLMLHQTPEQRAAGDGKYFGAHTVGAPDGGPGLAVLSWSTQHGDLRVAHFLGLHGVQAIPLIAWWLSRRRRLSEAQRVRLVQLSSLAYVLLFGITTHQAMCGIPLLKPDASTLLSLMALVVVSSLATAVVVSSNLQRKSSLWANLLEVR